MSRNILVVDDDEQLLALLRQILEHAGHCVETFSSAELALERLEAGPFDLVVSDIRMPGMSGIDLLAQVVARFPATKVILMTGYADDYDASEALLNGADDYITKPFDVSRVLLSVGNVLKSG